MMIIQNFFLFFFIFLSIIIASFSFMPPHVYTPITINSSLQSGTTNLQNKTIIIFPPTLWHYLSIEKDDSKILAIPAYIQSEIKSTILQKIYPKIFLKKEAYVSLGAIPYSVEQILFLKPDIIITWQGFSNGLDIIQYPGLSSIKNLNLQENMDAFYTLLGNITSKQKTVENLSQYYKMSMQEIKQQYSKAPSKTLLVISSNKYTIWNSKTEIFNQSLQMINAKNVAENLHYSNSMNIETLLLLNPDYLFIINNYLVDLNPVDIYKNPIFQSLNAVKNKHVYKMPRGGSRMEGLIEFPILLQWLAQIMHPEITNRIGLREQIIQIFNTDYHYSITDNDLDEMLAIKENTISPLYDEIFKNN